MGISLYFCNQSHWAAWGIGQILLSLSVLQWFFLLRKFGHGEEIKSHALNMIGGHIASFFCVLPFNQWRIQNSVSLKNTPSTTIIQKRFVPPFNVVAYSMKNYWNIKRLFGLFPDKKIRIQFVMSILVMNCLFFGVIPNVDHFWKKFGLGYILFLILIERWLLKQAASRPAQRPGP